MGQRGLPSIVLDLSDSAENDLSRPIAHRRLKQFLRRVCLLGIDIPCNTWSLARRAPPGSRMPSALRGSDPHSTLWGLPGLSEKDEAKVKAANLMIHSAVGLIRAAIKKARRDTLKTLPAQDFGVFLLCNA